MVNPANGEVIAEMPLSTEEDVNRAVAAAKRGLRGLGAHHAGRARAAAVYKLADLLEEHAEELSDLEAADAGKPRNAFYEDEMPQCSRRPALLRRAPARVMEGKSSGEYVEGRTSIIRREPIGVVGQITPWNYPLMMAIWKIGPALATGNTIVLKPAETTPITTVKLAELAGECLPKGVLNVITGHGQPAGSTLVPTRHRPGVADRLARRPASGSPRAAADTLKRVHLELGGKAPVIVFDDVDVEVALRPSPPPRSTTPARTARPPRACSPRAESTTTWSTGWPSRRRASAPATRSTPETTLGPAQLDAPARARRGLPGGHARPTRRS